MHRPANLECERALQDFEEDTQAWVLIVSGAGERAFSAGMDLRYRPPERAQALPPVQGGFASLPRTSLEFTQAQVES
jgi:crotonobetainyl-CoA hydratase